MDVANPLAVIPCKPRDVWRIARDSIFNPFCSVSIGSNTDGLEVESTCLEEWRNRMNDDQPRALIFGANKILTDFLMIILNSQIFAFSHFIPRQNPSTNLKEICESKKQ